MLGREQRIEFDQDVIGGVPTICSRFRACFGMRGISGAAAIRAAPDTFLIRSGLLRQRLQT
jgi:hypothetical protein